MVQADTWKRHQDTVYWVEKKKLAQRKGLKFYQTRSNAIILNDTLPAYCIPKVVVMETGEIIYEKGYVSPRWMKELDSEVAGSSKDSQRIQPKSKTQLSRTVRPVSEQPAGSFTQEIVKDVLFCREGTKNSRTVRPVDGQSLTQLEEIDIDFRVSGLPHAVVKEAENLRVQEHPRREALQADLQQNNVDNPFSNNSKAMIREVGNVELFELCETIPKVQCSQCLLYWNQGVIYCTCGHFSVESESRRKFNKLRLDALSVPHYVIKKVRLHGARHGKTEEQKEYHIAFNAWKRCRKRVDAQEEHYKGIHDRFQRDQVYRESQLKIGWTEQKCIEMDELAQQDHTYRPPKRNSKDTKVSGISH